MVIKYCINTILYFWPFRMVSLCHRPCKVLSNRKAGMKTPCPVIGCRVAFQHTHHTLVLSIGQSVLVKDTLHETLFSTVSYSKSYTVFISSRPCLVDLAILPPRRCCLTEQLAWQLRRSLVTQQQPLHPIMFRVTLGNHGQCTSSGIQLN